MNIHSFIAGLMFGFGLFISGMAEPDIVGDFFRLESPVLVIVMMSVLLTMTPFFWHKRHLFSEPRYVCGPPVRDGLLVTGSVLGGVGWAISAITPCSLIFLLPISHTSLVTMFFSYLVGVGLALALIRRSLR